MASGRNRTRATLVGDERSHHCVIAAPVYSRVHSYLHMRPSLIKRPPSQNQSLLWNQLMDRDKCREGSWTTNRRGIGGFGVLEYIWNADKYQKRKKKRATELAKQKAYKQWLECKAAHHSSFTKWQPSLTEYAPFKRSNNYHCWRPQFALT